MGYGYQSITDLPFWSHGPSLHGGLLYSSCKDTNYLKTPK